MKKNLFSTISFINLYSKNNHKLIEFYRDSLGIEAMPNQDPNKWYGFKTQGTTFAIEPLSNRNGYPFVFEENNPVLIQFRAHDEAELELMNQQLESAGVKILRRSQVRSYGTITNFLDPDGNLLEILLEKP